MIDKESVDWVTRGLRCTTGVVFRKLYDQLAFDVEKFNKSPETTQTFKVLTATSEFEEAILVHREGASRLVVRFVFEKNNTIRVWHQEQELFAFTFKWNLEDGQCELRIGEELEPLWKISCRALSPLFFAD